MKKKALALLLAVVMSISLCACGNGNSNEQKEDTVAKVDELLQGTWTQTMGSKDAVTGEYTFDEGEVSCTTIAMGVTLDPNEGTYEIGESTIKVTYDNGTEFEINYTLEDDELILESEDGEPYERVEVKPASEITEEDVENVALQKVYSYLQTYYGDIYDISASKYKTGKIEQDSNGVYTVKGTLYLYDDYGDLDDTATFDVMVMLDSTGQLEAENPEIEIER